MEYEYITFNEIDKKPKTKVYQCLNKKHGDVLGIVKWNAPWRQYCFYPHEGIVFSKGCLLDICDFIGKAREMDK